jgi:hypothetical protein
MLQLFVNLLPWETDELSQNTLCYVAFLLLPDIPL